MSDTSIEARMAALESRVADLERQRWEGPPRLGPKHEGPDPVALKRILDAAAEKIAESKERNCGPIVENNVPPVDRSKVCTTSGEPAAKVRAEQTEATGQHKSYIVLCEDERKKGFVRPYRDAYKHVGLRVCGKQRPPVRHPDDPGLLVCHMAPGHEGDCFDVTGPEPKGCGTVTTMGRALSETYARDPKFYGSTFCCHCNRHLPVNEFVWTSDGKEVGS